MIEANACRMHQQNGGNEKLEIISEKLYLISQKLELI
jgi:hypothetical protein